MPKRPGSRPVTQSINALARAVARPRLRRPARRGAVVRARVALVLPQRAQALASDEVLIAVADARSVALQRVRIPIPVNRSSGGPGPSSLAEASRRLAQMELVATEIAQASPAAPTSPALLTDAEERLLRAGGLPSAPLGPEEALVLHRASAEYARLLDESYTVEEAAGLLGVNTSRIRQRLTGTPRTLFGIKLGKSWRIPTFQFHDRRRLVPGLERVLERLPLDLHPVAVYRWFTSPNPDLPFKDDTAISPLDWLRVGHAPEVVAELGAGL